MSLEQRIRAALRDCYDPEIPLNLLDLGLLQSISVAEDRDAPGAGIAGLPSRYRATISLLSTTQDEGVRAQMTAQIENRLAGFPELSRASVILVDTPPWTPARITPAGRQQLKLDQPVFPILNNKLRQADR